MMTFHGNGAALSILAFSLLAAPMCMAQAAPDPQHVQSIDQKLNELTDALAQTQRLLDKSTAEIRELRGELDALRAQSGAAAPAAPSAPAKEELEAVHEQQDAMQ